MGILNSRKYTALNFFADDQAVFAREKQDVECMVRKSKEEYDRWVKREYFCIGEEDGI